ncbi:YaaL family protein [Paenibacillus sp. CC-CFT747]|nr:YaaL family protein [Paenibacillus sp. CC-CFT747]
MGWIWRRREQERESQQALLDKQALLEEIRQAQRSWENAQASLDWVKEQEEVDYAVYSLIAAEKKYGMLLKEAKRYQWENTSVSG